MGHVELGALAGCAEGGLCLCAWALATQVSSDLPGCWPACPPRRSGAQCRCRAAFPTCHCILSRCTLRFSCPSPTTLCIRYVLLRATSWLVSVLPLWPQSSARTGIVSSSFPVIPTEPRTVFGKSSVSRVLGEHSPLGSRFRRQVGAGSVGWAVARWRRWRL